MALYLKHGRDTFRTMKKLKFLFLVFLIVACQQLFSSTLTGAENYYISEEIEGYSHFEENNYPDYIYGEVKNSLVLNPILPKDSDSFLSNFKPEDLKKGLNHAVTPSNMVMGRTFAFGSACFSIIFIPLYIQTGNFIF